MTLRSLIVAILFFPGLCHAQHWRVEASGGIAIPHVPGGDKRVPHKGPYLSKAPFDIPTGQPVVKATGGLRLMRRDSSVEYGIGVQSLILKFKGRSEVDTIQRPYGHGIPVEQYTYLARPAIPVTAFFNYCHHRSKAHAFIGLSAGVVFAQGREMKDVSELLYYEDFDIYFQDATGYTIGGQLGFRRTLGKFDLGMELAANFVHLPLKQGTSNTSYVYNLVYFPVKGYVGYSF